MSLARISIMGPFRSRQGLILGVVRGLADHYRLSPGLLRLAIIGVSIFLAFWPVVIIYLAAALIMPAEPTIRPHNQRDQELRLLGRADPASLVETLHNRAERLERKVRRLEDHVTSKAFRTRSEFQNL
jgi:phage shock protein C